MKAEIASGTTDIGISLQHIAGWRFAMFIFGAGLYVFAAWQLALTVRPFCPRRSSYNTVGRLPYLASCLFNCAAGAFDPLGLKLFRRPLQQWNAVATIALKKQPPALQPSCDRT